MANLVIVESPSKAATIKGYLGSNYKVVASKGHVRDLPKYTPAEERRLGVDIATMPMNVKIGKVLLCVKEGETLASREREILERILENKKRRQIAEELFLSENTVKTYTRTLYAKLGVTCREELYALLLRD